MAQNDTATDSQANVSNSTNQEDGKRFTQDEIDKIVADRIARERTKYEKKYAGVDLDKYVHLTEAEEQRKIDEQKARGEFETILKTTVDKKDSVIKQLQSELKTIKVDGQLLNIASQNKVVNPQQVVELLKSQIRLAETGDVEVIDSKTGQLKYSESGDAYKMEDLVKDFIKENPHFVLASPAGAGGRSVTQPTKNTQIDLGALDMRNPEHRALYKQRTKTTA